MSSPGEEITAYCVKCREKRPISGAEAVFLGEQSRPATQGKCPVCGTRLVRFGRTRAHDDLDPVAHTLRSRAEEERLATGPRLVIVESPAKARTIGRFLGGSYHVEPSVGHIRDLPANRMGVDLEHDFEPRYVIPQRKKEIVKKLQEEARHASAVYLATDPDREGEAIAWHLAAALERQMRGIPVQRVEFHEITQEAVDRAFAEPREIQQNRVDAQQARRILDRIVGFTLSPLLRAKMNRKGLSAGRVQSVALRLVCEREREIAAFTPMEYWTIEADLIAERPEGWKNGKMEEWKGAGPSNAPMLRARLVKIRGEEPEIHDEASARGVVAQLERSRYRVQQVSRRERRRSPAPPFITSSLQQEASRKLGLTAQRTMALAQTLYEGKEIGPDRVGLITYMRTDSVHVAESAQAEARQVIVARFGADYLPERPPQYKTRARRAQEAHEAIRPTAARRDPSSLRRTLGRDELRLYTLIWQRFIASQMASAVLLQTGVDIAAGPAPSVPASALVGPVLSAADDGEGDAAPEESAPYLLRTGGSVVQFAGFLRVYEEGRDEGQAAPDDEDGGGPLPPLARDDPLGLAQVLPRQHFTEPPPRYTDAALIRALEEAGIGRPSTYAPIMATIQERGYVDRVDRKLVPSQIGFIVNDLLTAHFPDLINVEFTAEMEEKLDAIAAGEKAWVPMLHEFYEPFAATLAAAQEEMPEVEIKPEPTGEACPVCGRPLLFKLGRRGKFIGCSGWPECRYSSPIPIPGVRCPVCGSAVVQKRTRRGRPFYTCVRNSPAGPGEAPACDWIAWQLLKPEETADQA